LGWFLSKRQEPKFNLEIKYIETEISRSKRFGYQFGVLTVELNNSVPRGLSKLLPGRTISFHILQDNLRLYDRIIESGQRRRYYIILPETDGNGIEAVKKRIYRIAKEQKWEEVIIASVLYPDDGATSKDLLEKFS
jgi:hypothetical protein